MNLLFSEDCCDEQRRRLHDPVAAYGSQDTQPLHGLEHVVHSVWQRNGFWLIAFTQVSPLCFTSIFGHSIKHFLEPFEVSGQNLEIMELVISHPIKRLLCLKDLAVGCCSVS